MKRLLGAVILAVTSVTGAAAQSAVFIVRHAERADGGTPPSGMTAPADPDLSEEGRTRAVALARMLKDAKIAAIYVTEFKRTQQTAEPLARQVGIDMTIVPSKDSAVLIEKLKGASGHVLVVGHSNTVPATIAALGVADTVTIRETDYDNLFIVFRADQPELVRLHFP